LTRCVGGVGARVHARRSAERVHLHLLQTAEINRQVAGSDRRLDKLEYTNLVRKMFFLAAKNQEERVQQYSAGAAARPQQAQQAYGGGYPAMAAAQAPAAPAGYRPVKISSEVETAAPAPAALAGYRPVKIPSEGTTAAQAQAQAQVPAALAGYRPVKIPSEVTAAMPADGKVRPDQITLV
jgi:hypothetical protein